MNRLILIAFLAFLAILAFDAHASNDTCRISGTAYDYSGHPLPAALIRLSDRQTKQTTYRAADSKAAFVFDGLPADPSGQRYKLDVLSSPILVTGTHIPTRSVLGIAPMFVCDAGAVARADVKVQVR